MAVDITTLFTRLGKFFFCGQGLNTALATTVPAAVDAALAGLGSSLPAQYEEVRDTILDGQTNIQRSGSTANGALISEPAQDLILLTVSDDVPSASTIELAVLELIRQFEEQGQTVDAATVGSSLVYDSANTGNGVAIVSTKRGDGKVCLFSYAEDIELEVTDVTDGVATFTARGEPLIEPLMPTWPGGSGADATTVGKTAASADNLVTNGTFEANDTQSVHLPQGWIAPTATLGTTLKMGSVEVQTVVISGTPTGGFYVLHWVNSAGQQQTTVPLAFDAGESDVQTALRALVGLEEITVATTGTSPNYTHTITFTGVTNPAQLTATSALTGGAPVITPSTTTAGSANVFRGARSVEFDSDGSQLTTIMVPVALTALTQYACCAFMKTDSAPAAGVLTIDLVDGVGGTVLQDDQQVTSSFTVDATALTTSFVAKTGVFRTPASMPAQVYLRIRISTAVSNTSSVFIDEVYLGPMTELYTDGPSIAIFDGSTDWLERDLITLAITNDRAGLLHEWSDRVLSLRENRQQFPVDTGGTETIPDSLAAAYSEDTLLAEDDSELLTESGDTIDIES
jgi:hypothetical protein